MGCSNIDDSFSNTTFSKPRKQLSLEHRPRMLKDFLIDDAISSCSSTGFKSFPCNPYPTNSPSTIRTLIQNDINNNNSFIKSRSKTSSSSTKSALQAMINAVKSIHFTAVKSPSILPRSLSRRMLSKKNTNKRSHIETKADTEIKVTVTIKDIIRWKSFRDLVEEKSQPLDFSSSSPNHYTTTTTTVSTATTPCSSNCSSWCDSDFTAEYLPCWKGNNYEKEEVKVGKMYLPGVGEDLIEAATIDKGEERQKSSPVSVYDIEFEEEEDGDDEGSSSFFDQSLDSVERTKQKLMQKIQRFQNLARLDLDPINLEKWMTMDSNASSGEEDDNNEEDKTETRTIHEEEEEESNTVEAKARQLLNHVKETSPLFGEYCQKDVERAVLDFFRDELCKKRYETRNDEFDNEMLMRVRSWIDGEHAKWNGCEEKEAYVRDMEKEGKWNMCMFKDEQQEVVSAIENWLFSHLVDELLIDIIID